MTYEANRPVKTSVRTFEIIEQLSRTDHTRVSQLAAELDMSKGIVHNHLSTLRELGYVRKVGDDYRLSPKLLSVGFQARSHSQLYSFAHELLGAFANRFDTGVVLCERAGTDCVVVDAHQLPSATTLTVGTAVPISNSLPGLVISTTTAESDVPPESAPEYDPTTIGESVDEQGYCIGPITTDTPISCVAAPILDAAGRCRGSLGVLLADSSADQQSQRTVESTVQLRQRLESRFTSGWDENRSFATEKHSWIN